MRENDLHKLLYTIYKNKKNYDQKIGASFYDLYIRKAEFIDQCIPVKLINGSIYGLTIYDMETLLYDICGLVLREKETALCNEILTREIYPMLKCHFNTDRSALSFVPNSILMTLKENALHFIKVNVCKENQYMEEAATYFSQEKFQVAEAADGFAVKYKIFGRGNIKTMILINAYGVPPDIWKHIIYYYAREYRVIVWENRGSRKEHSNFNLQPHMHSLDLESILKQEKVTTAVFVCWCSGLKIFAEFYKRNPDIAASIVIIAGYFNPVTDIEGHWTDFDRSIGKLSYMIKKDNSLTKNPLILELIQKLFQFDIGEKRLESLLSGKASLEERYDIQNALVKNALPEIKELITLPFRESKTLENYAEITIELQKHEILTTLSYIQEPTLIINAGRDMITDIRCAGVGQASIRHSLLVELPAATHWCIWENYDEVISAIELFIEETKHKTIVLEG